jgi:glutamate-ammonia-ligase adenylyltransferase
MSETLSATKSPPCFEGIPDTLRERLMQYWQDFQAAAREQAGSLDINESQLRQLLRVWAGSDFVAKTCLQKPALLFDLIESGDLNRVYEPDELTRRAETVFANVTDMGSLQRAMRWFRLRESVRIAWRDLAGEACLDEVMAVMTELADCCVQQALVHTYHWMTESKGTPHDKSGEQSVPFIILGLGKLGGRELNFSSDIDLIFTYGADGETDAQRPISNHQFFTKLGRELISALETRTEDGYVFRVDMRLRPNGRSGPLALSFDATENYYQTHGRDWERYALTKARVVAGDRQAGEQLLARLRPFVYRKYLDYGAFESIREMKELIERELERKEIARNIKLGQGGIREIEFIAQSFQLIRGGREPALQSNRLFEALDQLDGIGALDTKVVAELKEAYIFLRNLEHRLQMMHDQQTHTLPLGDDEQSRLAFVTGCGEWSACERRIHDVMQSVHNHFKQVFVTRTEPPPVVASMQDVWLGTVDEDSALQILAASGYSDPKTALDQLQAFRHSKAYHAHSNYGRERVDRLMPLLIHQAASTQNPNHTLQRLLKLVETIGRRSAYLMLLYENPLALSQLVKLSAASAWISNWISRYPLLLDELLDPISTSLCVTNESLAGEIRQRLGSVSGDDLEDQMEVLREVRQAQTLKVAAADVLDYVSTEDVARQLCVIAEAMLDTVVTLAENGLRAKYGEPSPVDKRRRPEFGIVAYGKLGSFELGYHSDLDLVFLHHGAAPHGMTEGGDRSLPNQQYYGRLGQRIVHMLTTRTPSGVIYEIDTRLRPSGRSGPLVASLDAYHGYQLERAWTWEHQALVRARMVNGSEALNRRFEAIRFEVLTQARDPEVLKRDICAMRQKMVDARDRSNDDSFDLKQGKGGIVDIEFIVQYYVLRWAHMHPDLTGPRSSLEVLDVLEATGLVSQADHQILADAYRRYLTTEHRLKLAERAPLVGGDDLADTRRMVAALWQRCFEQESA